MQLKIKYHKHYYHLFQMGPMNPRMGMMPMQQNPHMMHQHQMQQQGMQQQGPIGASGNIGPGGQPQQGRNH